jgi:hypothetical protein
MSHPLALRNIATGALCSMEPFLPISRDESFFLDILPETDGLQVRRTVPRTDKRQTITDIRMHRDNLFLDRNLDRRG